MTAMCAGFLSNDAQAVPSFARQTGQNCVSCHAGGQFPELTPYGRMFKMTGYTIGERTMPLSGMGVFSYAKVADTTKSDDPGADFYKNGAPLFATGSLFAAGKIADNVGAFVQVTYDNYAVQGSDGKFRPGQAVYASTKRGLKLFTEALTKEMKDSTVRVISVRPGILLSDGFIREIKAEDPAKFAKQRRALNILGDQVEDVAPWIVEQILANDKNGATVAWLSTGKILGRFATAGFKKRDILSRYGL